MFFTTQPRITRSQRLIGMNSRQRNPVDISLYAIADPERSHGRPLDVLCRDAMAGGASLIQYRDKKAGTRTMVDRAHAIAEAIEGSGVQLIINDRVDVALAVLADGVHLGQKDLPAKAAREILGDSAIIGLSVKTEEDARSAPLDVLDYVFIGGVFQTSSKDNPDAIGLAGWQALAQIIRGRDADIPIGAIAGIDESNIADMIAAGADGVAVISAIFMADDVEDAARGLRHRVEHAKTKQ